MSVIGTYIHNNAKTSLGRFVVNVRVLYKQVFNEQIPHKSNGWSVCIGTERRRSLNRGPSSTALLFSVNGVSRRNFSKPTAAHAKIGHVSWTTFLLGVICHPIGKTWCNRITIYKIWQLCSFSHSWDMDGAHQKFKTGYVSGTVCRP